MSQEDLHALSVPPAIVARAKERGLDPRVIQNMRRAHALIGRFDCTSCIGPMVGLLSAHLKTEGESHERRHDCDHDDRPHSLADSRA